jgi:hypothetical protein
MPEEKLLSTAYFPPSEYFSLIKGADRIIIEREENYIKQTYRNRCRILASNGIITLSVPVMKGELLKVKVKDIIIDYSKRWQQIHLRAMTSSYGKSPFFQFYIEGMEKILLKNYRFLFDLNNDLLDKCLEILRIKKCISHTYSFEPVKEKENDYRYRISPKVNSDYTSRPYIQVFGPDCFITGLSILDLIFNVGPGSANYL